MFRNRPEKILFFSVSAVVAVYLVLRALYLPLMHDEAATFFHYIHSGRFRPFQALWDANNHVLNSAFGFIAYKLFGYSPLALRFPNLLAFIPYAFYGWMLCRKIDSSRWRIMAFIAWMSASFVLSFLALCRGYGLSLGFMAGGIFHLLTFIQTRKYFHLLAGGFFLNLMLWSNLAMMNNVLLILSLLGLNEIVQLIRHKKFLRTLLHIFTIGAFCLPVLYAVYYTFALKEHGALYYGSRDGFIPVTLNSLLRFQVGSIHPVVQVVAMLLAGLIIFFAVRALWQKKDFSLPFTGYLIAGNVVIAWLLAHFLKVNFPEDRAGIYFIPLFILGMGHAASRAGKYLQWVGLTLLFFPLQLFTHANPGKFELWKGQASTRDIYDEMYKLQQGSEKPLSFSAWRLTSMSWSHLQLNTEKPLNIPQYDNFPCTLADILIIDDSLVRSVENEYTLIMRNEAMGENLMRRKNPLQKTLLFRKTLPEIAYSEEYLNFYEVLMDSMPEGDLYVWVRFEVDTWEVPFRGEYVISALDSAGMSCRYEFIPLSWLRTRWHDNVFEQSRIVEALPEGSSRFVIYLWNIDKKPFALKNGVLEIYQLSENP